MRARAALWVCIAAGNLLARQPSVTLADFEGPSPLAGWSVSSDPDNRMRSVGLQPDRGTRDAERFSNINSIVRRERLAEAL